MIDSSRIMKISKRREKMPWYITAYIVGFCLLFITNLIYSLRKLKLDKLFLAYELCSAGYLILLIIAYWSPILRELLSPYHIFPYLCILAVDLFYSLSFTQEDFGIDDDKLSHAEIEFAKAFSVIFASPGYIIGALTLKTIFYQH